ncbi:MAG: LytR/AlgR family response regulator transcription factor [Vicinamibacterales bacterium]
MTAIRTVVVEDEPVARERLVALLADEPEVAVVATCADGRSAAETIAAAEPDLVLLDIQLPELDGLSLARTLCGERRPAVVFITAHDQYALPAFEIHALDYLLKPFSEERFRESLAHVRRHLRHTRAATLGQEILELMPDVGFAGIPARPVPRRPQRLAVKGGGRVYFVDADDIDYCEAAGNYACLHTGGRTHLIRETMNSLEARLDAEVFVRIHRSTIVNVERIQEIQSTIGGEFIVKLRDGSRLTLSRGYRDALQSRINPPQ